MLIGCLQVFFFDALIQITNKTALHRWNKGELGSLGLIILVITITYFLESNQRVYTQVGISYYQSQIPAG